MVPLRLLIRAKPQLPPDSGPKPLSGECEDDCASHVS